MLHDGGTLVKQILPFLVQIIVPPSYVVADYQVAVPVHDLARIFRVCLQLVLLPVSFAQWS
jgi:hypothetical protein